MKKITFLLASIFIFLSAVLSAQTNTFHMTIKEDRDGCKTANCLLVKFYNSTDWEKFYAPIEGFNYQPGTRYRVKLERTWIGENDGTAPNYRYKLLEIMDKNPASDNTNLSENIEMWVKEEKADCTGVAPMECLQVRYQKTGDWELFHSHIEGFDYEPGYQYRLLVSKTENPNPPQDASRYSYKLIQVKEKNRVSSPNAGSQAAFLEKYNWNLIQLNGSSDHLNGAHIIFDFSENRVAGSTGCNRFGGPFEITGDKISFGALFTTKMACLNDNKEREFLALLNTEDLRFDIADQTLNFYSGDELIAIFGLQEKE